jgi:hypothetical protein
MYIIYRLRSQQAGKDVLEKHVSALAIDNFKNNVNDEFLCEIGRIFRWSGYAFEPSDEEATGADRLCRRGMTLALIALADHRVEARIECKGTWASLEKLEVV